MGGFQRGPPFSHWKCLVCHLDCVLFFFFLRNVDPAGMDFERRWTASQRRGQHADDQQLVNGNPTRGPDDRYSAVVGYIRAG